MPVDPGLGTERSAKGFQDFFARWGAKANLRSVWNTVVPVALVDRFRGDDEGSLYGITAETTGAGGEHPSIFFGAITQVEGRDEYSIEILDWSSLFFFQGGGIWSVPTYNGVGHVFTPLAPYNPVLNLNPVGTFIPGMWTNKAFTRGVGIAFGGSNPTMPTEIGWQFHNEAVVGITSNFPATAPLRTSYGGQPGPGQAPIRVYPGGGIAWQFQNPTATRAMGLRVSIIYRERPIFL